MISNSKIVLISIITSLLFGDRPYAVVLGIAQDGGAGSVYGGGAAAPLSFLLPGFEVGAFTHP